MTLSIEERARNIDQSGPAEAYKVLKVWRAQARASNYPVTEPRGFRDLMWCPYMNEPAIIHWAAYKPYCPNCHGNFEPETHPFLLHIAKPEFTEEETP
jgi:hypothetical protein